MENFSVNKVNNGFILSNEDGQYVFKSHDLLCDFILGFYKTKNEIITDKKLNKIKNSDISKRTMRVLSSLLGFEDWQDIALYKEHDFMLVPNLGRKSINEIKEQLALRNLYLTGKRSQLQENEFKSKFRNW